MIKGFFNITIASILLYCVYKANLSLSIIILIGIVFFISLFTDMLFKKSLKKDMEMKFEDLIKVYGQPKTSERLFLLYKSSNKSRIMTSLKGYAKIHKYEKFSVIEIYGYIKRISIDNIINTNLPPRADFGFCTGKYCFYFKRTQSMIDEINKKRTGVK